MLNDSETNYMLNAIPYIGKVEKQGNESVSAFYVRKLSESVLTEIFQSENVSLRLIIIDQY